MNQQARFKALNKDQKFQFLYYAAKQNEAFILNWFKGQSFETSSSQECVNTILNSFDFLKKLFFPVIDSSIVHTKETMLNGMADEIVSLSDEVIDMEGAKGQPRALAILTSIECLYTTLIDYHFSSEDNDVDEISFHVILLCAIGYCLENDFEELTLQISYLTHWNQLEVLSSSFPGIKRVFEKFTDDMLSRFETVSFS